MKYWCWLLFLFSFSCWSKPTIKVGGYPFAPFVVKLSDSHYEGLTLDLIRHLNEIQQEVRFVFVPTSATHRYKALEMGRFSLMLFEDSNWGWQTDKIKMSTPFLGGGEVYVALKQAGRDQRFFDNLETRQLIGVSGYHYGIGQFNADPAYLHRTLNISLLKDNTSPLQALLKGRGEVAIINIPYLSQYLLSHPDIADKLLISTKWDQQYQHRAILHPTAPITPEQVEKWLAALQKKGDLARLWAKYGVQKHTIP